MTTTAIQQVRPAEERDEFVPSQLIELHLAPPGWDPELVGPVRRCNGRARPITDQIFSALQRAHCWLTNRIKAPTVINTAIRIPRTSEITGWRLGLTSFDLAPFCAAPLPNQKRSLSIDLYLATRRW